MKYFDVYRFDECQWILWDRVEAPSRRAAVAKVPSLLKGRGFKVSLAAQQVSIKREG